MKTKENEPVLQPFPKVPNISIVEGYTHCVHDLGNEPIAQLKEILRFRKMPGRVSIRDYFYYRLFDQELTGSDRRKFVGSRLERLLHGLTYDRKHSRFATDKCLFESTLRKAGFPVPETLCLFQKGFRAGSFSFHTVHTVADLSAWLKDESIYPLFGKPRTGIRSGGVLSLSTYDPDSDQLNFQSGREMEVPEVAASVNRYRRKGYLFQRRLNPHPQIDALTRGALATVRLVVLIRNDSPSVYRAAWKLPANNNIADNFWRGNVLAGLDPKAGEVVRSVTGVGLDMRKVSHHPDSGLPVLGIRVPEWKSVVSICLDASRHIPGIDMQAWDIAITDSGPVLMEVNIGGDYCLPQLSLNKGMLEKELIDFLADCAHRRKLAKKFNKLKLISIFETSGREALDMV